jgi:hypothetical protein
VALTISYAEEAINLWKLINKNKFTPNLDTYKLLLNAFWMEGIADDPLNVHIPASSLSVCALTLRLTRHAHTPGNQ